MRIVRKNQVDTPVIDRGGELIFELLGATDALGGTQNHSMIRLELTPGASSPAEPHFHRKTEETYVILSGHARMMIAGEVFELEAGDIMAAGIGEAHQITAAGHEPLKALAIMAPGFDPDDVFPVDG